MRTMEALEQKKLLMLKIKEIALCQQSAIKENDIESLERLISERQRYMNEIENISDKSIDADLADIIGQIMQVDEVNRSMMDKLVADISSKINGVKKARDVFNAYNGIMPSQPTSAFVDKKT